MARKTRRSVEQAARDAAEVYRAAGDAHEAVFRASLDPSAIAAAAEASDAAHAVAEGELVRALTDAGAFGPARADAVAAGWRIDVATGRLVPHPAKGGG